MTSTTGTDEHPDVAEISALTEGLLAPERTVEVRNHMADCELCAEVGSSLEEIRALLGTLPGPARMPDDVAGRIDAALAAEALLDSTAPEAVSRGTCPDDAASGEQRPVSRETGALPGTRPVEPDSVDRAGHPDVSRHSRSSRRPWSHRHDSTGPGGRPRARRWRRAVLGAAAVFGFGIGGAVLVQSLAPSGENDAAAGRSLATDSASRTADGLNAAALEGRVEQLLADSAPEQAPSGTVGTQTSPPNPLRGVAVPPCVRNGIDSMAEPIAAEEDVFEGKAAYIVVLPHRDDATRVDAYVVDAACVGTSSGQAGDILLSRSYPRR
ncbi:hypothetical protein [Streptomyces sp. NPDC048845]|uniref:hypothetical protein n=1 Tax=Streptomyces sp. NPDC048845 TaxID=3155390 RepID=UPI0034391CB7